MNIKTGRYASVGLVTASSGDRFGVREGVSLPDADAGTELESCYRADPSGVRRRQREFRMIPLKAVLTILFAVLLVCAGVVAGRCTQYDRAVSAYTAACVKMEMTRATIANLEKEVAAARDLSRIGFKAVTELGMVASDSHNTIVLFMPEVEKYVAEAQTEAEETAVNSTEVPAQSGVKAGR